MQSHKSHCLGMHRAVECETHMAGWMQIRKYRRCCFHQRTQQLACDGFFLVYAYLQRFGPGPGRFKFLISSCHRSWDPILVWFGPLEKPRCIAGAVLSLTIV
jgi:hypothetical protein